MKHECIIIIFYLFCRIKNSTHLVDAFNVDPIYLKHHNEGRIPDYRVNTYLGIYFKLFQLFHFNSIFLQNKYEKYTYTARLDKHSTWIWLLTENPTK